MKKLKCIISLLIVLGGLIFVRIDVMADGLSASISEKANYVGVLKCFGTKESKGGLKDSITVEKFTGINSLLEDKPDKIVREIGEYNSALGKGVKSCAVLFSSNTAKKIPSSVSGTSADKEKLLSEVGYELSKDGSSSKQCHAFKIASLALSNGSFSDGSIEYAPELCVEKNGSNYIFSGGQTGDGSIISFKNAKNNSITLHYRLKKQNGSSWYKDEPIDVRGLGDESAVFEEIGNKIADLIGSAKATNNVIIKSNRIYFAACKSYKALGNGEVRCEGTEYPEGDASQFSFKLSTQSGKDVFTRTGFGSDDKLIQKFSDSKYSSVGSLKFSDNERYSLYSYYLSTVFGMTDLRCSDSAGDSGGRTYTTKLWWAEQGRYSDYCSFNANPGSPIKKKVNGVCSDTKLFGCSLNLDQMLAEMNSLNPTGEPEDFTGVTDTGSTDSDSSEELDTEETCRNSEGSAGLGWFLCPALTMMGNAAKEFYEDALEPSMVINSDLLSGEGASANVRDAWENFRDMANVLFIIFLMIVIFSQLTGIGIDNYGIKKILPRMIVAAVLINLSYLICVLLVDVSNIAGNGFQAIFDGLSGGVTPTISVANAQLAQMSSGTGNAEVVNSVDINGLASVGVFFALVGGIGAGIWGGIATVVSLLISGIGVLVSIFFLFILLSARQAAVIVMVVMSPLIIVAYMLPNTKKFFDKWVKAFEAMLLIYPIAGLLMGGGNFVSKLLLSFNPSNIFSLITAMVIGAAPVFFIPMFVKEAFAAFGKIGGALSSFGSGASKAASKYSGALASKIGKTDMARDVSNTLGMHSLSTKRRAEAVQDAGKLAHEREMRKRLANTNKEDMIKAIAAAEEAKAVDEEASQRLSLMRKNGITVGGKNQLFTVDSAQKRMDELARIATTSEWNSEHGKELAALAKGMAAETGGGGKMASVIRKANENGVNSNFMSAMGDIYKRDRDVKSVLNKKDASAAAYTENVINGDNRSYSDYQASSDYKKDRDVRVKTFEAGLNQSGTAAKEYVDALSDDSINRIVSDQKLFNSLDNDVQGFLTSRVGGGSGGSTGGGQSAGGDVAGGSTGGTSGGSAGGGQSAGGGSTSGGVLLTGRDAEAAFNKGRQDGTIVLPH